MSYAVAYWCVLIVALLPYVWTSVAKASAAGRYDNRDPRTWMAKQTTPRAMRANAAQLNGFEAFPLFAASVLMAHQAGVPPQTAGSLALVVVVARIAHGVAYIAGQSSLRSLVWFVGVGCMIALIVQAALHIT